MSDRTDCCGDSGCCDNSGCCGDASKSVVPEEDLNLDGPYICYCDKVTKDDIKRAIENGAATMQEVIKVTGAMRHCNCKVNNPKGRCCIPEFTAVYEMYSKSV